MTSRHDQEILRAFLLLAFVAGAFGCDSGPENTVPAVPAMAFPANGATDQANALELQWHPSPDAQTYHVQVAATSTFSTPLVEEEGVTTTFLPVNGLQLGATHYWHVRAHNAAGFSAWSATWTFTPTSIAEAPAGQPVLTFPANGAASQPTTVVFRWEALAGATAYHIQVALEPDFVRRTADMEGVRSTNQKVTGLVHTYTYYWRIRASNPAGFGAWSPMWNFVVESGE